MSFEAVAQNMKAHGFKFALAHFTPEGIKFAMPTLSTVIFGAALVPIWVQSQDEDVVVCILGSEPPDMKNIVTIPMSMFVSPIVSMDM